MLRGVRKQEALKVVGISLRTYQRWKINLEDGRRGPLTRAAHAFSQATCEYIFHLINSPEFANLTPWQIVPKLADQGIYVCSESTMYRILRKYHCLQHRCKSRPPTYNKPKPLIANKPNQIWSWDITYVCRDIKGMFYYVYLIIDIFSRKIIHAEAHERECNELSAGMIVKACQKENIKNEPIVLHSDNGGPMKGATMLVTLERLGITPSNSRPHVSNDNAYSEALFRVLKYCPSFPDKPFLNIDELKNWLEKFADWYNNTHLHSGIKFVTPASRHQGLDKAILEQRQNVYAATKQKNPNRWSGQTRNWSYISTVYLNANEEKKSHALNQDFQLAG